MAMKRLTEASLNRRSLLGVAGGALLATPLLSTRCGRWRRQPAAGRFAGR